MRVPLASYSSAFPSTVTSSDIVAWLNGDLQAYSDIAGTTPIGTGGIVGRLNEASPLIGNWQASSSAQRLTRESNSVRSDFGGVNLPGQQLVRLAASTIPLNDSTLVCSYMDRDGFGGPNMGLCAAFPTLLGAVGGGGALRAIVNASAVDLGLTIPRARRCTFAMRWTPTALKALVYLDGVPQTPISVAMAVTGGNTGSSGISAFNASAGSQGYYGSASQMLWLNRACTDSEAIALVNWADSKLLPPGYPTTAPLLSVAGDSIARAGAGVNANDGWPWVAQQNLRASVAPTLEVCNVAIVGSGVSSAMYAAALPFYSAQRAKNLIVLASGTNDLANGNSVASVISAYFSACDFLRTYGYKVIAATILPRTDVMSVSQATFDANRASANSLIISGSSHYDAIANVAAVAGMGADADSNNTTNYSVDKIHPNGVGHRLLEPTYRSAVTALI